MELTHSASRSDGDRGLVSPAAATTPPAPAASVHEHPISDVQRLVPRVPTEADRRAARRSLRGQIARLERELSDAFVTAYGMGDALPASLGESEPRLLDLGDLERVRDDLADRLRGARLTIRRAAEVQEQRRLALERMLLDPGHHRFERVALRELGEPGCGVWEVRPRLGLIGMLMGWWQVKLSSGCPLAMGRAVCARP